MSGDERPYPQSLCHRCTALKRVRGAKSTFLMCTALPDKYPRQPVVSCPSFSPQRGDDPPQT
jgi:hypothetical protein